MTEESTVSDDVKNLVNDIIKKYDIKSASVIKYGRGSEVGDGFMSKTYAVDIGDEGGETLNLFLKCAINIKLPAGANFDDIYANEIYFYDVVVPAFMAFVNEKGIEDGFRNVPRCYGTVDRKIVALENLKKIGYELCDKELVSNEQHVELVFKTYAKFHAISFVYKDQKREEYDKIVSGVIDFFAKMTNELDEQRLEAGKMAINDFFKKLDPRKDKFILDQSDQIMNKLTDGSGIFKNKTPYAILTQGDCWCNNMMFKYESDKRYPLDVILVDWQVIRTDSPVLDLSYFFYTAAASSKQMLRRVDDFLEIYHDELSAQIRKMGSDPNTLYPISVLKREWQKYSSHGFAMAFLILRAMLGEKDQMPNFEEVDIMEAMSEGGLPVNAREDEYINRLRNLSQHFLLNEFL